MAEGAKATRKEAMWWKGWFVAAVLLVLTLLYFYYLFPGQDLGPVQPIYFSHRIHAGVKQINCRFCHPYVERSEHAGLPEVEKCFFCHKYIIPMHPQILKEKQHLDVKSSSPLGPHLLCSRFCEVQASAAHDCANRLPQVSRRRSVDGPFAQGGFPDEFLHHMPPGEKSAA